MSTPSLKTLYNHDEVFKNYHWDVNNEPQTAEWLTGNLRDIGTFVDIGCQKGMYSELVLRQTRLKVIAADFYEWPDIHKLREIYPERLIFIHSAIGKSDSIVRGSIHYYWGNRSTDNDAEITTRSVDSLISENLIGDVKVLKIDVDSWELETLEGSLNLLATQKPIVIIELNPIAIALRDPSRNIDLFLKWFLSIDYRLASVLDNENYLFVPN